MNRIIIDNKTELSDFKAVELVGQVIGCGRLSNDGKQYPYITVIGNYQIDAYLNKRSDRFVISKKS